MTLRDMGKVAFMHIQDKKGQMQAYLRKDVLGEETWEIFKLADIGDIVGIKGKLMITKTGELKLKELVKLMINNTKICFVIYLGGIWGECMIRQINLNVDFMFYYVSLYI